ncbi:MAG: ABC transporter substrate-binding protein, partial [Pseudorhodoplanes sp.]
MSKRAALQALAGVITLAAVFGWSVAAYAQGMEKIKLALHWNAPTHQFIHYYAAIKLGFFKEQNLDVELATLPGSVPAVLAVNSGDAQIGQASGDAILVNLVNGAPLKIVFLLFQQTPTGVIVFENSGIKNFAGLRGKTVSTAVASPEGIMLNAHLRDAGLNPEKDLRILNVAPGAKLTMQLTGQADASTGFADYQYIQAQMAGHKVSFLPFSTNEAPLYGHAVFANSSWLEKHPDTMRRFLTATLRGLAWAHDNIDKAVDMVVGWDPTVKIDPVFTKRGLEVILNEVVPSALTAKSGIGRMEG